MDDRHSIKSDTSEPSQLQPLLHDLYFGHDDDNMRNDGDQMRQNQVLREPNIQLGPNAEFNFDNVNTTRGRYSRSNNFRESRNFNRHRVFPNPQDYQLDDYGNTERRPNYQQPMSPQSLLQTIHRWNLQFSGARGEDVENYINRIDEGRELLVMRESDLLKAIPFTLKDAALTWYRGRVNSFRTWQDVKIALRSRYADPDYQLALREEIANRTQANNEPVCDYLACMNGLFARTDPLWSEWECIRYAHRNMLPAFKLVIPLHRNLTMDDLEAYASRQERTLQSVNQYRPPPLPENSMCPAYAYSGPRKAHYQPPRPLQHFSKTDQLHAAVDHSVPLQNNAEGYSDILDSLLLQRHNQQQTSDHSKLPTTRSGIKDKFSESKTSNLVNQASPAVNTNRNETSDTEFRCWNCDKIGHGHRLCPAPKRRFCYRCRASGVTKRDCPHCNKGNSQQ
ncbi:uncharacterized protein LOC122509732 [Leptopilina heterotoma]|uniref:uncharacterized protein LOC122509732 n=1 Tax=Leptopilina heterotoma TaxID=63436 RepID=UPI001CA8EA38|nr:uncharacterized protein LOC122509732 [Leptopilina heterotoma]